MALTKYKLGELIEQVDERNSYGLRNFYGLNINKEFMPTVADTNGLDETKYKVVRKNRFVFSGMQTGRDMCIRLSMYMGEEPIIVSPAYTTFEVSREDLIKPEYLFMVFQSKEKDRWGAFCSDGSIRTNLDWDRFIDFNLLLPPIAVQRKYVEVYRMVQNNYRQYCSNLDDLKLTCDAYIENLRNNIPLQKIGEYIEECNLRNSDLSNTNVKGVESSHNFVETKANTEGLDFTNYKIVKPNQFAYNPSRINIGSIALRYDEDCIISPMYIVFGVKETNKLLPEYLFLWLTRSEFLRSTLFYAIGSVRDTFDFEQMKEVSIPIPSIAIQQDIVNIYRCYIERQRIATDLKAMLNRLCPILIQGSIQSNS